jgi:eukaryotic-like serine/threonine-protein kinase
LIGTVLKHRYEIVEKIGEGSLFTVYRCDDKIDNRSVAVKILLPQYASNRMFAERLLVEAQSMVGLAHPGIVEVYDCGEDDGSYYVVVEYVRGVDLKERIRRSAPFSLSTVVDVGLAVCDVLDFAHRRGFMHGDLRPGNILVSPEGQIKLADFWVSNAIASASTLRTNAMMRSVHYMAPEIAEAKPATPASDVYSIGVILFELLTATVPYDGDTPIAIALKHSREPIPSPRTINPGTPKSLEAVITRALQKSPQDRFRSARAMHHELKSVRDALHFEKPLTWSAPPTAEQPTAVTERTQTMASAVEEASLDPCDNVPPFWLAARKTLLAIIGVVSVLIAAMIIWAMTTPGDVRVPSLLGKPLEKAEAIAAQKRIEIAVKTEQFNEDYPAGTIYYMNPSAGRSIKSGKVIDVWVSKGSRFGTVPNVVKLPLEDAKTKVTSAGLNVGEVTQDYSDTIPAGNIIKQTPSPGTKQERGQAVSLVFSLGPKDGDMTLTQDQYDANAKSRSFTVKFKIPPGAEDQKVAIIVQDDFGETNAYSDIMHPGDLVDQKVTGVGNKVTIRIYIDDKLVKELKQWK